MLPDLPLSDRCDAAVFPVACRDADQRAGECRYTPEQVNKLGRTGGCRVVSARILPHTLRSGCCDICGAEGDFLAYDDRQNYGVNF